MGGFVAHSHILLESETREVFSRWQQRDVTRYWWPHQTEEYTSALQETPVSYPKVLKRGARQWTPVENVQRTKVASTQHENWQGSCIANGLASGGTAVEIAAEENVASTSLVDVCSFPPVESLAYAQDTDRKNGGR